MKPHYFSAKNYLIFLFLLLLNYQSMSFANVAEVIFAKGDVYALDLKDQRRKLQKKSVLYQGDTIVTKQGHLELRFSDGGRISFYENTEFKITEYQFLEKKVGKGKALFRFVKGVYRTILGSITQERYQVKTNIASIGTRGTEYKATLDDKLQIDVFEGVVVIKNQAGAFEVPMGQSVLISDNVTLPIFLNMSHRAYRNHSKSSGHLKRPPPPSSSFIPPPPPPSLPPPSSLLSPPPPPPPVREKEALPTIDKSSVTIENIINNSISVESLIPPPLPPPPPPLNLPPPPPP